MERRVFDKAKIDDLVLLNNISEDEILGTLRRRFESDCIYTTIGPVLLSVNPFHDMSRLYPCWLKRCLPSVTAVSRATTGCLKAQAATRQHCQLGKPTSHTQSPLLTQVRGRAGAQVLRPLPVRAGAPRLRRRRGGVPQPLLHAGRQNRIDR